MKLNLRIHGELTQVDLKARTSTILVGVGDLVHVMPKKTPLSQVVKTLEKNIKQQGVVVNE